MPDGTVLQEVWRCSVTENFNTLLTGKVFSSKADVLVLGCEDGSVRLYEFQAETPEEDTVLQPFLCLETKAGPVQCLAIHDVTRFGSVDLISGDSRGTVTIFSRGQILDRQHITADCCISSMQVDEDPLGNTSIVVADTFGVVTAVLPFTQQWKTKLEPRSEMKKGSGQEVSIRALQAFSSPSSLAGHATNYVLAADTHNSLYGAVVSSINAPSPISAMCCGIFMSNTNSDPVEATQQRQHQQVALGCRNGAIYIFSDFQILQEMYTNVKLPITQLKRIDSIQRDGIDSLLCCGTFKAVLLIHGGMLLSRFEVSDLVVAMDTRISDKEEVIVGCQDKTLFCLRIR